MKTQLQMYWEAQRRIADQNEVFMQMVMDETAPLTKKELRKLIEIRPSLWGRFSSWLEGDSLLEG